MIDLAPISSLSRRIKAGEAMFSAWIGINDSSVVETLMREDFDVATLDMQHGAVDFQGAVRGIGACALAGKPAIVRIPVGEFQTASRVLDAGAAAVIAPMIKGPADARRFAAFMKYPPLGERSWGPRAALTFSGLEPDAYFAQSNAITLAIAMIETRAALDSIDEILVEPGIDGVFVGPADLSVALNGAASVDPDGATVDAAMTRIVDRARAHGKFAAAYCATGARARALAARGYALCSISSDQGLLRAAARAELAQAQ
jgi:4-hydroxy-2-oxoheptanedioate aldolase